MVVVHRFDCTCIVLKLSTTIKLFKNSFQSQGLFALLISLGENLKMLKNDFEIFVHCFPPTDDANEPQQPVET